MGYLRIIEIGTFYKGLTLGILLGLTLSTFKNFLKDKLIIANKNTNKTGMCLQQKSKSSVSNEKFKMALLVRHDLKMGKGKVAAQCSHAMVHCYEKGLKSKPTEINGWESNGKLVDIYKIADEETMLKYKNLATQKGFNNYIIVDAGRTQVAPKSKTVMAIGPDKCELIDMFTESLSVYV